MWNIQKKVSSAFFTLVTFYALLCPHSTWSQSNDVSLKIDQIQLALEALRGKPFKHKVKFAQQSTQEFGEYIDKSLTRQLPESLLKNYGKIINKLGLYRGPEITDFKALAKQVMQSQAAAYYDPETETFYVVMHALDGPMLDAVYAHELYHGFQDQYFDLENYILATAASGTLNDDQILARQAVVEGEATFLMTLWTMKNMLGTVPAPGILRLTIQMQSQIGVQQMLQMVDQEQGKAAQMQSEDMAKAVESMREIPAFMLESMIGAYMKGMAFVFEVQQHGWEKVAELYSRPPTSTEQILHPEKWLREEKPLSYVWPEMKVSLHPDWDLLESNTIGELQWRIIFTEHGLDSLSIETAAGWGGDSFAVYENTHNGKLLLLLLTDWDSVEDAVEFEQNYRELLTIKYPNGLSEIKMWREERTVKIIEGAPKQNMAAFRSYVNSVQYQ